MLRVDSVNWEASIAAAIRAKPKTLNKWWLQPANIHQLVEPNPILIKVSSKAVHHMLVGPNEPFAALSRLEPGVGFELCSALLGMYSYPRGGGSISVMKELRPHFSSLEPSKLVQAAQPFTVWQAVDQMFVDLVRMAHREIVFADLRVGWDLTYNLMYSHEQNQILLVDFESLTETVDELGQNKSAFNPTDDGDALLELGENYYCRFVWWQYVLLALCWLLESSHDAFDPSDVVLKLRTDDRPSDWTFMSDSTWAALVDIADAKNAVDDATMTNTKVAISALFQSKYPPPPPAQEGED